MEDVPSEASLSRLISLLDNQDLLGWLKDKGFLRPEAGQEKVGYLNTNWLPFGIDVKQGKPNIVPIRNEIIQQIARFTPDLSTLLTEFQAVEKVLRNLHREVVVTPEINSKMIAKHQMAYQQLQAGVLIRIIDLSRLEPVIEFLQTTTVHPFFEKYAKGGTRIKELELWLMVNAIVGIICTHGDSNCCATEGIILATVSVLTKDSLINADGSPEALACQAMDEFTSHLQRVPRIPTDAPEYSASEYCALLTAMTLTYLGRTAFVDKYWGEVPPERLLRWLQPNLSQRFLIGDAQFIEAFRCEMRKRGKRQYAGGELQNQFSDLQRGISESDPDSFDISPPFF
jgi:hypothetical protein